MYIAHLPALWLSYSFQCRQRTNPAAFKKTRDTREYVYTLTGTHALALEHCVYHTCIFTYINMCISHLLPLFRSLALSSVYNVYTQLPSPALPSAYNEYQPPFQALETRRFYDTDTHRNTSIGSRSLARVYVYSTQQHTGSSQQHTGSSQQHTTSDRQLTSAYNSTVYITHVYLHI